MIAKRILVVEDDKDIRRNLVDILESEGYQLDQAANGQDALQLLKKSKGLPSVILLDLMMPVMDGFQFRASQEADPILSGIPIIIMTADGYIEAKRYKIGAKDFIRKPIDLVDLLAKIEGCCA